MSIEVQLQSQANELQYHDLKKHHEIEFMTIENTYSVKVTRLFFVVVI